MINHLIESEPTGGCIYLISRKWWTRWELRENGVIPGSDETGPIDNSDLLNEQHQLIKRIPNAMIVRAPPEAWHLLKAW